MDTTLSPKPKIKFRKSSRRRHLQPKPLCPPTLAGVVAGVPAVLSTVSLPVGFVLGRRGRGSHVVRVVGRVVGCGVVLLVAPPLAPALPALVVEFARAGPVSLYSAWALSFVPALGGGGAGAEEVPVVEAAPCHAEWVSAVALMALPEPLEW